jgi:hypothetical protein
MKMLKILYGVMFTALDQWDSYERGMKMEPDVLCAMGSTADLGPIPLCRDIEFQAKEGLKHVLSMHLRIANELHIPFIASPSTGGGDGALESNLKIIDEICKENKMRFRFAVISGEIDKNWLLKQIADRKKTQRLIDTPRFSEHLTPKDVNEATKIVAQMGPEPIIKGLENDVDGVLTGRSLDTGLAMAVPFKQGFDKGTTAFMSKILEGASLSTEPLVKGESKGESFVAGDLIFGELHDDYALVRPTNPLLKCSVSSTAAYTLYERENPLKEVVPGGYLDLSRAKFEQHDEATVKISGAIWNTQPYTIKLEGGKFIGYRTLAQLATRDPMVIENLDRLLKDAKEAIYRLFPRTETEYTIYFKAFGKNAVMGPLEPEKERQPHEALVTVDVIAKDQKTASFICAETRRLLTFRKAYGILGTGVFTPSYIPYIYETGPVYVWNIWHTLELDDPCEPFKMRIIDFPRSS